MPRDIVAEFQKTDGGRLYLHSLIVIQDETGYGGKQYRSRSLYDVDLSRAYGYIFHMSGGGGDHVNEVSGIYWTSGNPVIVEKPCQLVSADEEPPFDGPKTAAIRARNRTRRLKKLPKAFDLEPDQDLLDWLEHNAIDDDAVWCSDCRDSLPGCELCRHCWWCDKTGWYSTPTERCECICRADCAA